jgi:ABC-type transport system substrate-binding protein
MKHFTSLCLALASVSVAGAVATASRPHYGGTLRVEAEATVRSLDPAVAATDDAESALRDRIVPLLFDTLTTIDVDGLAPGLATSWDSDAQGARWLFHIRPGVVLHNGAVLEPLQVAASLSTMEPRWSVGVDGGAVVVRPNPPIADLPWALAESRYAIMVRQPGGASIGSGPFQLDRLGGTRLMLRAHEACWRARPFADAVQIEMGRPAPAQLADLESDRADIVSIRATESTTATRRGLRVEGSRPLELVAVVFEPRHATAAHLAQRRAIAGSFNRAAMSAVLLPGQAEPGYSILPAWLSAYAALFAPAAGAPTSRGAAAGLPPGQRQLLVRVDPGDELTRAIAERLAVDAREAGFIVTLQAPAGLAPRPDARVVRIALQATTPDRAFAQAKARLFGESPGYPPAGVPPGYVLRGSEQELLEQFVVVPLAHVRELYAVGDRVGFAASPAVQPTGAWNFANLWVQGGKP